MRSKSPESLTIGLLLVILETNHTYAKYVHQIIMKVLAFMLSVQPEME